MLMRAGKLDREITISRASITIDASGVPNKIWNDVATLRAELVENSATETVGQVGAATDNAVLFRTWFSGWPKRCRHAQLRRSALQYQASDRHWPSPWP